MTVTWVMKTHPLFSYRRCTRCVMDTTDSLISFDAEGVCNHCHGFNHSAPHVWHPNDNGRRIVDQYLNQVRQENANKDYDVVMGLSGGADSCYMAYLAKKLGLRALVIHVDTGWNSDLAVSNIENVVKNLGFDLHTVVINWRDMRDLQVAMLKSGVAACDAPQDHAIFSTMFRQTLASGVRHVLSGVNFATECILPRSWGYNFNDTRQLKTIHARFGSGPLKSYPFFSFEEYCTYTFGFPSSAAYQSFPLLNYLPYNKAEAMRALSDELGFRPYAAKHGESRWTKFFQEYYLPTKFGYDKRLAHLSSLVVTEQMTRDEALAKLELPPYDPETIEDDIDFVVRKLELTRETFDAIMRAPCRNAWDYTWNHENFEKAKMLKERLASLQKDWTDLVNSAN